MNKIVILFFIGLFPTLGFTSIYAANPLQIGTNDQGDMTYKEIGIPSENTQFYEVHCQITKDTNLAAGLTISSNTSHANVQMQYYINGEYANKPGTEYTYPMAVPNVLPATNELVIQNVGAGSDQSVFHFSNYPKQADPMVLKITCETAG